MLTLTSNKEKEIKDLVNVIGFVLGEIDTINEIEDVAQEAMDDISSRHPEYLIYNFALRTSVNRLLDALSDDEE